MEFFGAELFVAGFTAVFVMLFGVEVVDLVAELEIGIVILLIGDLGRLMEILVNSLLTKVFVSSVKLE